MHKIEYNYCNKQVCALKVDLEHDSMILNCYLLLEKITQ